jgi:hypothetical protein
MRGRDKLMILLVAAIGLTGAGYMLYLQAKVDDWDLDKRPETPAVEQEQSSTQNGQTDAFAKVSSDQKM